MEDSVPLSMEVSLEGSLCFSKRSNSLSIDPARPLFESIKFFIQLISLPIDRVYLAAVSLEGREE